MPKFLVSGASSGLGQYLAREFEGIHFRREPIERKNYKSVQLEYYDCIVHCATDVRNSISENELLAYHESHIELTKQLLQIPHIFFVFISSAAVYANPFRLNSESDPIPLPMDPPLYGLYGLFKLLAEQIVSRHSSSSLILRSISIVGPTTRPTTNIMRVLSGEQSPKLTLSATSTFNLVSMIQIKRFIEFAMEQNITGVFNLGSTKNVLLEEIANMVGNNPQFGTHQHNVHLMDTTKIRKICPFFEKTSLEIAQEVAEYLKNHPA